MRIQIKDDAISMLRIRNRGTPGMKFQNVHLDELEKSCSVVNEQIILFSSFFLNSYAMYVLAPARAIASFA